MIAIMPAFRNAAVLLRPFGAAALALLAAGAVAGAIPAFLRFATGLPNSDELRTLVSVIHCACLYRALSRGWLRVEPVSGPCLWAPFPGGNPDRALRFGLLIEGLIAAGLAWRYGVDAFAPEVSPLAWVDIVAGATVEELLMRAYLLRRLTDAVGLPRALLATTVVFALLHLPGDLACGGTGAELALGQFTRAAGGLAYALMVVEGGRLWPAILLHSLWNILVGTVAYEAC